MKQQTLPGFEVKADYSCPLCGQVAQVFGQYSPLMGWGVCRECSIKYPYPIELFVPSTRRNADKEPYMIDPDAPHEVRERRIQLDEMLRCAVDPSRLARPIVKYNLSGLELRHPIRRSQRHKYASWKKPEFMRVVQMRMPVCDHCGAAHDRDYELMPGMPDYWARCQDCEDKERVEALYRHKGIFGGDDIETVLDRLYKSMPELFERGVLPDYWYVLIQKEKA